MGIQVQIAGIDYQCVDYQVTEEATPLGVHDSSQSVGGFTVTVSLPEGFHPDRPVVAEQIANQIPDPYVTTAGVVYDPSVYQVTEVPYDPANPRPSRTTTPAVRIERIESPAGGDTQFYFENLTAFHQPPQVPGEEMPTPSGQSKLVSLSDMSDYVVVECRCPVANTLIHTPGVFPPLIPTQLGQGAAYLTPPTSNGWHSFRVPKWPGGVYSSSARAAGNRTERGFLAYPGFAPPAFTLNGDTWAEFSIASSPSPELLQDSMIAPAGDSTPQNLTTSGIQVSEKFSWASQRRNSPTLRTVTAKGRAGSTPNAAQDVVRAFDDALGFEGLPVVLRDSERGQTSGVVLTVRQVDDRTVTLECESDLSALVAYRVVAPPSDLSMYEGFSGTLEEAVRMYAGLAGCSFIYVDPAVAERKVSYPKWIGESWTYLKQLASVQGCEIAFVGRVPVFRPIRKNTLPAGVWISSDVTLETIDTAESIEIINQKVTRVWDAPILRPSDPENRVLEIEDSGTEWNWSDELVLDTPTDLVAVYPAEDGFPYWGRGSVTVKYESVNDVGVGKTPRAFQLRVNPEDPSQVLIRIRQGPSGPGERAYGSTLQTATVNSNGDLVPSATLYGWGVRRNPQVISVATGAARADSRAEVGMQIDSPFIVNATAASQAALRALPGFSTPQIKFSGVLSRALPPGELGTAQTGTYSDAQDIVSDLSDITYGTTGLPGRITGAGGTSTYRAFQVTILGLIGSDFQYQEFGNVAGSRFWHEDTRRWFRVRSAAISPESISIQADDDLTLGEAIQPWISAGRTYAQVESTVPVTDLNSAMRAGAGGGRMSYTQFERMGVPVV